MGNMKTNKGFTLVEVLIASVILFSSIAVVAELYSSSQFTSNKISNSVQLFQVGKVAIPVIKSSVRRRLLYSEFPNVIEGAESINGVAIRWSAMKELRYFPPKPIDELEINIDRFAVYRLDVEMQFNTKEYAFSTKVNVWQ